MIESQTPLLFRYVAAIDKVICMLVPKLTYMIT